MNQSANIAVEIRLGPEGLRTVGEAAIGGNRPGMTANRQTFMDWGVVQ